MKFRFNCNHGILGIIFLGFLQLMVAKANAQYTDSIVFTANPGDHVWIVPQGVTTVQIDAYGAQGGSTKGGKGGRVQSELKVTPGQRLFITVGSQPKGTEGGYNGGGKGCGNGYGGGGATDIRIGSQELTSRILVAGGGGGAGYGGAAGAGGGNIAGDGIYDNTDAGKPHIAKGGTQDAGGSGARAYFSKAGKAGEGGEGINSRGDCSNGAMAGGGGGYFGGGASGAGGAGGGSSYTNDTNSHVVSEQGVNTGDGKLVIYWVKPK